MTPTHILCFMKLQVYSLKVELDYNRTNEKIALFSHTSLLFVSLTKRFPPKTYGLGRKSYVVLPPYNLIHNLLLFAGSASEINPRGLNAFMPHQVCKQRDVVVFLKEVLGKTMSE